MPSSLPQPLPESQPPSQADRLPERLLSLVQAAGAAGMTAEGLMAQLTDTSRSTLNRRLAAFMGQPSIDIGQRVPMACPADLRSRAGRSD